MDYMNWMQSLKLFSAIGLTFWFSLLPLAAIAIEFKPPRRSIPARREGGGTRGPLCVEGKNPLTTLLPQTNIGLTTVAHPQFFWFTPKTRAQAMKFSLFEGDEQNPQQTLIYEKTIDIPAQPGVVSFSLPDNSSAPGLEVGRTYFWTVTLICQLNEPLKNIQADGWIERVPVESDLATRLKTAQPSDRPQLYAQNGFWFDTLSTLTNLRCTNPKNSALTQSWTELLQSVKLNRVASEPFTQVCSQQTGIRR